VTFTPDGRHAWPSTGEVIDSWTKKNAAAVQDEKGREVHSEEMVEVQFKVATPVRAGDLFGVGPAAPT
jgi:hypothetical protein